MTFSEHKAVKNDDGTWTIEAVPVFELGEHKGFQYTVDWAAEALKTFADLKAKKWLPRVIVGHTAEGYEKKAVGFWDNLRLIGNQFFADLVRIPEKIFQEIKDRNWPGRSVEVNPEKKKFTALALLGGSEPYFKFEPLEVVFEADESGEWIDFNNGLQSVNNKPKEPRMAEKTFTETEHAAILAAAKEGFSEKFVAEFKRKHGVTPEEALAQARAHEAQVKKFAEDMRQEKISAFCEGLKKQGLAPALADAYAKVRPGISDTEKTIAFDEGGEALSNGAYIDKFFDTLLSYAKEGKMLIQFGDAAGKDIQKNNQQPVNSEAEKRKYYQANKIVFEKMGFSEDDYVKYGE